MDKKTIESLCFSRTQGDLWDELNRNTNASRTIMHLLPPDTTYLMRFLGPFIRAKRIYTGSLIKVIQDINIKAILNGNKDAYDHAMGLIEEKYGKHAEPSENINTEYLGRTGRSRRVNLSAQQEGNRDPYIEAKTQLNKIYGCNKYWEKYMQKCIMINALCEDRTDGSLRNYPVIQVIALSTVICDTIGRSTLRHGGGHCKINGLCAHSIEVSKVGQGIRSQYNVVLLPESDLSPQAMNKIVTEGLYDIPTIIETSNKKRYPFIYQIEPNYRMSTELMSCIFEEHKRFEERKHIDRVEEKINEIPFEAFEHVNNTRDAIGSLEI